MRGRTYDLKVGYTCNNHCVHCVIESNIISLRRTGTKIDTSYADILNEIESVEFAEADTVVLTGGEITIRKEFIRILKAIVSRYPQKRIHIQTNGRNLKPFVREIYELSKNVQYVIAVHSIDEAVHNEIVGNKFDLKSPYLETMETIDEIISVFGNFKSAGRIEIVLSNLNIDNLFSTIKGLHEKGIDSIGISYPHLDGFYIMGGLDKVREIGFPYSRLKDVIPGVYNYLKNNPDLKCDFEEFPACVWRDENGKLYPNLPNLGAMNMVANNVTVKFPGMEKENDFLTIWNNMHRQPAECSKCVINCQCHGIWFESELAFGDEGLTAVTQEEISQLKGGS